MVNLEGFTGLLRLSNYYKRRIVEATIRHVKEEIVHVNKLLLNKRYNPPLICCLLGNADVPECLVMLSPALVQAVSLAVQNISFCFNLGCDAGGLKYSKV